MAPTLEDKRINNLIKKHLLEWELLLDTEKILGVHPAADASPKELKAILAKLTIPAKWMLYGTRLQQRAAIGTVRLHYAQRSLQLLEGLLPDGNTARAEIRQILINLSGSISIATAEITKAAVDTTKEKNHKQTRSFLRTVAHNIGRGPNLFSMDYEEAIKNAGRTTLTTTATALAMEINRLIQEQGAEKITLPPLTELSRALGGVRLEQVKEALLELGGFSRPLVYKDAESKLIVLTTALLYDVKFFYNEEEKNKEGQSLHKLKGYGGAVYLKNQKPLYITVEPHRMLLDSLYSKGGEKKPKPTLGSILISNEAILLTQGLSDMAAKLFTYTASGYPMQSINKAKLYKYLNLQEQVKAQGEQRILQRMATALDELQEKEHLASWSLEEDIFRFTYTSKFVKHQSSKRKEKQEQEQDQEAENTKEPGRD